MVGVMESRCGALVGCIVKIPFWRCQVPDELIELVDVFRLAGLAHGGGEIILILKEESRLGCQRNGRLLSVPHRLFGKKVRRAISAQVGDDDPVALCRKDRRGVYEAIDIVGSAMQQDDYRPGGGTIVGVADV